jgi:hypothetical protein
VNFVQPVEGKLNITERNISMELKIGIEQIINFQALGMIPRFRIVNAVHAM